MSIRIGFHGAARTVTGSKHLLNIDGKQILIDCGLFQGGRELRERNWQPFGFEPSELDAVIVTHAHVDHIGLLPKLVKEGYQGPIHATPATIGISKISLPDSGRLQEEEARSHNKHQTSRHTPALPLYTEEDAYRAIKQFRPLRYNTFLDLPGGAKVRFLPAGHILGSAFAEVYFRNGERILMGGDLGRFGTPIINDPTMVDFAEYLVVESTYGDRLHGEEDPMATLEEIMHKAMAHGSCVLVPSFSIGRTQEILYHLSLLQQQGRAPRIPIILDSPMAVAATDLYDKSYEDHDVDMKLRRDQGEDPLNPEYLEIVRDRNQSKAINARRGPMMVIAGSGMANGGRIIHHLRQRISDPSTIVLFTGYQGNGTLGRDILDGNEVVQIFGQDVPVHASIFRMTSLSAHADQSEIMRWLAGFKSPPKKTFIVHGEPEPQEVLRDKIVAELGWKVEIPEQGQEYELS